MAYKTVRRFRDTKHNHVYEVGDVYPKEGEKATKGRLEQLSTTKNDYKKVFIQEEKEASKTEE